MDATTVAAGLLHDVLEDTATSKDGPRGAVLEATSPSWSTASPRSGSSPSPAARAAGGELPQDAGGHGPGHPGPHDQAGRPAPQHAHASLPAAEKRARDRPGDAGHLRPARPPARHGQGQGRAGGPGARRRSIREVYDDLQRRVAKRRLEREAEINQVITILSAKLAEVGMSESQITGRPKHFYSIYKKMTRRGREFDEIYDLTAVRILTPTVRECYGTLGLVHSSWKPVPGRFKDFIAMPKSNMYQSLHTTVIGPKGDPVEIQIRTPRHAPDRRGGHRGALALQGEEGRARACDQAFVWLRQLLEWQKEMKDPREFMETVKVDLFPDEVYVFTPEGRREGPARGLDARSTSPTRCTPRSATTARAPRVNGKLVPLRHVLRQGDIVEVVTSPTQKPSRGLAQDRSSRRGRARRSSSGSGPRTRPLARPRPRAPRPRGAEAPPVAGHDPRSPRSSGSSPSSTGTRRWTTSWPGSGTANWRPRPSSREFLRPDARRGAGRSRSSREARPPADGCRRRHGQGRGRRARPVREVLRAGAGRPDRGLHHPRPRNDRARPGLSEPRGASSDNERTVAVEWAEAEQRALPVKIAVHIGRDRPGPARRYLDRDLLAPGQHREGRGDRHRGPQGAESLHRGGQDLGHLRASWPRDLGRSRTSSTSSGSAGSRAAGQPAVRPWSRSAARSSSCSSSGRCGACRVASVSAWRTSPSSSRTGRTTTPSMTWASSPRTRSTASIAGTDLTRRDTNYGNVLPDVITIYQGPIQEDCETVEDMEELVRDTVVHEVGHYFGLDDDRLAELEDGQG